MYILVVILFAKPVTVEDGAIIGVGLVVNKDIPACQVWAGVPAQFICNRFQNEAAIPANTDDFKAK